MEKIKMQKIKIDKKIIQKVVNVSQAIEGYNENNKSVIQEVKSIREKYGIKVSVYKK